MLNKTILLIGILLIEVAALSLKAEIIKVKNNKSISSIYNQCIEDIKWDNALLKGDHYYILTYCNLNLLVINFIDKSRNVLYLPKTNQDTLIFKIDKMNGKYFLNCTNDDFFKKYLNQFNEIDLLKQNFDSNMIKVSSMSKKEKMKILNSTLKKWEKLYNNNNNETIKTLLLLDYTYYISYGFYFDLNINIKNKYLKKVFKKVEPNSLLWKKRLNLLTYCFISYLKLKDPYNDYLNKMLLKYPLRRDAEILISDILKWSASNDDSIFNYYLDFLELHKDKFYNSGDLLKKYSFEKILLNSKLPHFKLQDIFTSKYIESKKFQNGLYLIDFWATWCSPCIDELKKINSLFKKYKNFKIITISLDEDKQKVKNFIAKNKFMLNYINLWDPDNFKGYLFDSFNSNSIPYKILIKDGIIIMTNSKMNNYDIFENILKSLSE